MRSANRFSRVALAVWLILATVPAPGLSQERTALTQNPLAGSQVFGEKGCVKCHSVNGLGGELGPDLGRISARRSFYELAAAMWNHLPEMGQAMEEHGIQRPQMTSRQAGDLIAFLFTLDYFDPPGDVEAGKRLFVEKKCVVCHRVGVFGGVIGPSLDRLSQYGSPILVAAAIWNHGPSMAEEMAKRNIERPSFSGSELNDLIAYLESVGPQPLEGPLYVLPGDSDEGRVVFVEKACVECHSVQGIGGRVGPDLARRGYQWGLMEFASAMWNKAPAMMREMRRRDIDVPQLGAGEMADLVAYLYSVQYFAEAGNAEEGRVLLRARGCLGCHSLGGRGGRSAPDLRGAVGMGSPAEVIAMLWNHSGLMETTEASWPVLTAEDVANIAAYMQESGNR